MVKKIPSSYCLWCEEKLATKEDWPYCSRFCKARAHEHDSRKDRGYDE